MNIQDLRYIVAVDQFGHFGKAAFHCYVSQPTLSMQIKKLEEELGLNIFERSKGKVLTTDFGKAVLKEAHAILEKVQRIEQIAKNSKDPLAGPLHLGAFPTLASYYFPQIMPLLNNQFPKLSLYLLEEKTEVLVESLKEGRIDAAFLALPISDDALEAWPLFQDPFYLAVSKNHPLSRRKRVSLKDIRSEELLLLDEGHCLRDQALDVCFLAGAKENEGFRATSLETLRQMVASGLGITLMPKIACDEHPGIVYLPMGSKGPAREIALISRKTHVRQNLWQSVHKLLSKA